MLTMHANIIDALEELHKLNPLLHLALFVIYIYEISSAD